MSALPHVQPFSRRGVCPALSTPMKTGDGLLSRIAFTNALAPSDLDNLCGLAARHGNGVLDITARGSFQFRGLTSESAVVLERDVLALGLPLRRGLAVEISPLAGNDSDEIVNPRSIATPISERAMALRLHERLAAKMSVIVDGGGLVHMGNLLADIRVKAVDLDEDGVWQLMLGGSEDKALRAGVLRTENTADCVVELLACLAERGTEARGRDLDIETVRRVCGSRLIQSDRSKTRHSAVSKRVDQARQHRLWHLTRDLFAAVISPAFGQVPSEKLSALSRRASGLGIRSVLPGPDHALYFLGQGDACTALLDCAHEAGFVVGNDDPRRSIAVCTGSPACLSAFAPVQELADFAATQCAQMLDGSFTLHLSGCGKGCAHPPPSLLAFSGTSEGLAFGYSAKVSAAPDTVLSFRDQKAALSRLARLYEKEHKPGESARTLLTRLGQARVVEALRQD